MTGTRRAIVAPIAGTTRDSLDPAGVLARARVRAVRHRRAVRRQRGSAARAGRPPGAARHRRWPTCWSSWSTAAKGWSPGDDASPRSCARPAARCCWRSTRPTTSARRPARWSSISSDSSRSTRFRPSTARASAICSTRSWRDCQGGAQAADARADRRRRRARTVRPRAQRRERRDRRRHRRPAERRQVVAASTGCCARSGCWSATCRARRATRSTRC